MGRFGCPPALLRVAVRELPDPPEIVVVFDGENAWDERTAADPAYKAHRPTDEAAMAPIGALADVIRGLRQIGLAHVCIDTAEADDVIASLVATNRRLRDVWIMSADRDFYQLLDNRVRILNTLRRPGRRLIDHTDISAGFGVAPWQWCDRTSLVGDPSDGIRGVRGVGSVTAARILAGALTIEDLPGSGRLTGRIGAAIEAAFPDLIRWKELIRLRDRYRPAVQLTGMSTPPLPPASEIVHLLGLW